MAKLHEMLAGLLRSPRHPQLEAVPERQPARMIVGGPAAPELIMIPMDGTLANLRGPKVYQLKADGIAALYVDGRVVSAKTGEPLDCALHCQPGLSRLEDAFGHQMAFPGEYVADDGFTATLAEHKRGEGTGMFWIYDAIPHGAWVTGRDYEIGTIDRLNDLRDRFDNAPVGQFVGRLDHWLLSPADAAAKFAEITAAGFEGIVGKAPHAGYTRRRSRDWVRIKKLFTVDGPIIDMMGRADGTLKTMVVRTDDGPVKVAAGWSVAEGRTMLAAFTAELTPGPMWAEISFERTVGVTRAVRGARFHRIRDAKGSKA